jgi:hypothetical protein
LPRLQPRGAIVRANRQGTGQPMFYEDHEPGFFAKIWQLLYHYWND